MAGSPDERVGDWASVLGSSVRAAALAAWSALPGLAGLGLVTWGAWQVYEPAGPIVAGSLLLADRVMTARAAARHDTAAGGDDA